MLSSKLAAITFVDENSVMFKEFLGPDAEGEPLKFEMDLSLGIIESYDVANALERRTKLQKILRQFGAFSPTTKVRV